MSFRFILDTDAVSYAIRGAGRVGEQIVQHTRAELCISAITLAEIRFGAERVNARRLNRSIDAFLRDMPVLPFDADCARTFGRIGARLAEKGETIGEIDTMIAAHALTLGVTLVTNDERHFSRVPGLRIVNWF